MATSTTTHPIDEQFDDGYDQPEHPDETTTGIGAWAVSLGIHAVILLVLAVVVIATMESVDRTPVKAAVIPPTPPIDPPTPDPKMPVNDVVIPVDVPTTEPTLDPLDLPVADAETEDEEVSEVPQPKGRAEALAQSELGGAAFMGAIGAGGPSAGMYGGRDKGGRTRGTRLYGGSRESENAVERALKWFMRHQSPNGQWDVDGYPVNCQLGPKCEPGTAVTSIQGDVAITSYAILAFLGAGYDHSTPNKFRSVVRRGLEWLVEQQGANGQLGQRNYEQGVAAMALAEAYGMTNDPWLREPAQAAIDFVLSRQAVDGDGYGLGWDYTAPKVTRNDSSVTGWNVMALKSARASGLNVGDGLEGAKQWLDGAWKAANPDHATITAYDTSVFPYTWNAETDAVKMHNGDLTCVGALSAVFLGHGQGDPMLESMGQWIMHNQLPTAWPTDTYYLYYNTLSMFQLGNEFWLPWNERMHDLLVDNQRVDGDDSCFTGSWNPTGAGGHKIDQVGRTLVTAYCVLSLEVYYRYERQADQAKRNSGPQQRTAALHRF